MVNRKTGIFSMEVKKSVDKGVRNPKFSNKTKNTQASTCQIVLKGVLEKILTSEYSLCQGVVTLGSVMYRTDLGILFLIWFAVHARVCVSLCVSPLSPQSTCC